MKNPNRNDSLSESDGPCRNWLVDLKSKAKQDYSMPGEEADEFLELQEIPLDVLALWLTEARDADAHVQSRDNDGQISLYIRDNDGMIVRVKRVYAELDEVGKDGVKRECERCEDA